MTCNLHEVTPEQVLTRWMRAGAQCEGKSMCLCSWCVCCGGPCKMPDDLCSKCADITNGEYLVLQAGGTFSASAG